MYSLDTVLDVRRMASEEGMNVTNISRETGISRTTIYKFTEKKDFNSSQARGSNGKTVVDLEEIRKEEQEGSPADTVPTDGQKARDDEAQAAPPADKGPDDGLDLVRALLGTGQGNRKERPSKLDPYKPFIIKCIMMDKKVNRKQRHTNKRILELIGEQGYDGGHTIFDDFVRKVREALKIYRQKHDPEGYIPLVHLAGESQADFGKARFEEDGLSYDGSFFVLSFPFSNAGYLQQHFGENQECLLESLKAIFEHLGGVPREIWFDNASAIVTKILDGGERQVTERFRQFKEHYGFKAVFMNPDRGCDYPQIWVIFKQPKGS